MNIMKVWGKYKGARFNENADTFSSLQNGGRHGIESYVSIVLPLHGIVVIVQTHYKRAVSKIFTLHIQSSNFMLSPQVASSYFLFGLPCAHRDHHAECADCTNVRHLYYCSGKC